MPKFEMGMIVRLKRGGPKMTIVEVGGRDESGNNTVALCVWLDELKQRQQDSFDLRMIEEVVPPPSP